MKIGKTNAMRILDQHKVSYTVHEYPHHNDEAVDGLTVAGLLNQNPNQVFKTLVTQGKSRQYYVFVLPVNEELSLKHAAVLASEKSVEMIPVKEINQVTGYIRGGCSPLGMKKVFKTWIHHSALNFDTIFFSGGKIGLQIEMNPKELYGIIPVSFDL